tara:strand:- start:299 stop:646 length:348 start_codon:yes stop_codon:yes gene_type:complete
MAALENGRLTNSVVNVSAGSTSDVITCASNKNVYVKSVIVHNVSTSTTCRSQVYYVPNGGTVADTTRLFNVSVDPLETVYIEPNYPITLTTTGDKVSVGSSNGAINVFMTGDKEA